MFTKVLKSHQTSKPVFVLLAAGFITIIAAFYLFISIAEEVWENEKFTVDQAIVEWIYSFNTASLTDMMANVTETGSVLWLSVGTAFIVVYLFLVSDKSNWFIVFLLINMFGVAGLTSGLKMLFGRERPEVLAEFDGTGYSFPSGHSSGGAAFYGFLIYLVARSRMNQKLKWVVQILLGTWVLAIAVSRIFVGVHYFTDIIAGMALGLVWLLVCIFGLELILYRKGRTQLKKQDS